MELGEEKSIYYFNEEGQKNTNKVLELVLKKAQELAINKIIIFTSNGDTAFELRRFNKEIEIIAVSFPYKQEFNVKDKNGKNKKVIPETSKKKVREKLFENNIELVQGTMPFNEIIIPGTKEIKKSTIVHTLSLISRGLSFCVQSVLMATDAGVVEKGEDVIAMSADTAVVVNSANSQWLFHPVKGLQIKEIICKAHKISPENKKEQGE